MKNKNSNPFHSPIVAIFLENVDGSIGGIVPTISFNIIKKNTQCEFNRLELQDNAFDLFPVGALIVKDLSDIVSFIDVNGINSIKILFEDQSILNCIITSVTYVNNAASNTERKIVSINLSNSFYVYSQQNSLIKDMNMVKPKLFTIDGLISYISKNILDGKFKNTVPTLRNCDATSNYILYRPLNPDGENIEYPSDDMFQYMLYASSMAVNGLGSGVADVKLNSPKYLFWTEFGNFINLKYFTESPLYEYINKSTTGKKTDTRALRYAVYDGDAPQQKFKNQNGGSDQFYKKIYIYRNDPILQFVSKNYYYLRVVPSFLDELSFANTPGRNRTRGIQPAGFNNINIKQEMLRDLSSLQLDDGSKYNLEFIGSNGPINGITAGAMEIKYDKHWGYYGQYVNQNKNVSDSLLSSEFGSSDLYSSINFMGLSGAMNYVDSQEMWKNMFDFTPVHPNTPLEASGITNPALFNLQKIIDIRYDSLKGNTFLNPNLEIIRKVENENFIMYALCCMGLDDEESFFALLTNYSLNPVAGNYNNSVPSAAIQNELNNWSYKFEELLPTGVTSAYNFGFPGNMEGSTFPFMHLNGKAWGGISAGYTGFISRSSSAGITYNPSTTPNGWTLGDDTWAINLNEQVSGANAYLQTFKTYGAGWDATIPDKFSYRPIGVYGSCGPGNTFNNKYGTCRQVVRMNAISLDKLLLQRGYTLGSIPAGYRGKKLYYFNATNVVDGTCTP